MSRLRALPERYAVSRYPAATPLPAPAPGALWSVTVTGNEVSVVAAGEGAPGAATVEPGWRCWEVAGPLDFGMVGILAALTAPLAAAGISVYALSTYDTDYLLVKDDQWERARAELEAAGHTAAPFPA